MVGSKQPTPIWLNKEEADQVCHVLLSISRSCQQIPSQHCIAGASVWKFASVDGGVDPDVYVSFPRLCYPPSCYGYRVLVGIGVEVTFEVIAAAALLRELVPALRVRVVNVTDLMILSTYGSHPHALSDDAFEALFTTDRRVHFNYHGYPIDVRGLLGERNGSRISVHGYSEEGTTTSPFDVSMVY